MALKVESRPGSTEVDVKPCSSLILRGALWKINWNKNKRLYFVCLLNRESKPILPPDLYVRM